MPSPSSYWRITASACVAIAFFSASAGVELQADVGAVRLMSVPYEIPEPATDGVIYFPDDSGKGRATTLDPRLQRQLTNYLIDSHQPIAAVVVADAKTGSILAMAQGRAPQTWGAKGHSALHTGFPAASLFKTVVTTAAFEMAHFDATMPVGLTGGCAHVRETGEWLKDKETSRLDRMSLRRAFGSSCNGFFAKIAVNHLGLGIITNFARRFGWETGVPADFAQDKSPFFPPSPGNSSTSTVGRFAAGFGHVGISAVHAAWMMLAIANDGKTLPMRLFRDTPVPATVDQGMANAVGQAHTSEGPGQVQAAGPLSGRIFSEKTARELHQILDSSIKGGTAASAFRRGKYRKLHDLVGGKTGTLTGSAPKGLTTLFAGMAPVDNPEVVVASIVLLESRWFIKAPHLAAEGLWSYFDGKLHEKAALPVSFLPVATSGEPPVN